MMTNRLGMLVEGRAHVAARVSGISLYRTRYIASIDRRMLRKFCRLMTHARHDAGFTLVEVIVALAILSVGLSVLLSQISGGLQQTANAGRMAEAGSLVQSLMAEVGTDLPIRLEERDGQFLNGYRWHLKMHPYGEAKEREEWPIGLYVISTEVEWEEGTQRRSYVLTTLRVGPMAVRQ
jgi:general secretion pathway protein I